MAGTSTADILSGVPLLAGLSRDLREQVAAGTRAVSVRAGDWLFRTGESGSTAYVVIAGRMEIVAEGPPMAVIRTAKRGEIFGELALLREGGLRSASVRARRDSALVELGREQFELLIRDSPDFALALTRAMGAQIAANVAPAARERPPATVAVLGLHSGAPAGLVIEQLERGLARYGTVARLRDDPGRPAEDYTPLLDRAEMEHARVLLVAGDGGAEGDPWTDFCLQEADLVLAITDGPPDPGWLRRCASLRGCELIVVGREVDVRVLQTLCPREVHVCAGEAGLVRTAQAAARRLCGVAIGLVLSGGGARAFAHLGVLDELHAAGVRIDRFGGVSMGGLIAANAAMDRPPQEIYEIFRRGFVERKPTSDYTVPAFSLIRGRKTRRMLEETFGSARIEALPHRFFCVSCDLFARETVVHRTGLIREAVYCSLAIPGVFPPVADGSERLLVDGGVLDNLPVQTMARGAEGPVIAVDVSQRSGPPERMPRRRVDHALRPLRRALTGSEAVLPRLGETLLRTLTLGSSDTAVEALRHADLVIAPNVQGIGLLQWDRLAEVREIGRQAARAALEGSPLADGVAATEPLVSLVE